MDFEEYQRRIKLIHDEIQAIADRTANQAWVGAANPSNPEFVALMRRHAYLTHLSADLTQWMMDNS